VLAEEGEVYLGADYAAFMKDAGELLACLGGVRALMLLVFDGRKISDDENLRREGALRGDGDHLGIPE